MIFKISLSVPIDGEEYNLEMTPATPKMLLTEDYGRINELALLETPTIQEQIEISTLSETYYSELLSQRCGGRGDHSKLVEYIAENGSFMIAYQAISELYDEAKKNLEKK